MKSTSKLAERGRILLENAYQNNILSVKMHSMLLQLGNLIID